MKNKSISEIVERLGSFSLQGGELSENSSEKSTLSRVSGDMELPCIVVCPPEGERGRTKRRHVPQLGSRSSSDESRAGGSRSVSEAGSIGRVRRSTAASFRRVIKSLTSVRSHSCGVRQYKEPAASRSILRAPVSYTYVRGLSGLPTQRVPRQRGLLLSGLNR